MTNIKKLIALCQDLQEDPTVELTQSTKAELRGLIFRSLGEVGSLERELGPSASADAKQGIDNALNPIRARLFAR